MSSGVLHTRFDEHIVYHHEDGGGMFPEMSVLTIAARCNAPDDIRHCQLRGNITQDSDPRPYRTLSLVWFIALNWKMTLKRSYNH
jgi:hypothetical protein